jgi:hypothetical protein
LNYNRRFIRLILRKALAHLLSENASGAWRLSRRIGRMVRDAAHEAAASGWTDASGSSL